MGNQGYVSTPGRLKELVEHWSSTIPNDGMIRYLGGFNQEHLIVCSHDGLRELLNQRAYDFIKPLSLFGPLRRKVGNGLLTAEGDAHKVSHQICTLTAIRELY